MALKVLVLVTNFYDTIDDDVIIKAEGEEGKRIVWGELRAEIEDIDGRQENKEFDWYLAHYRDNPENFTELCELTEACGFRVTAPSRWTEEEAEKLIAELSRGDAELGGKSANGVFGFCRKKGESSPVSPDNNRDENDEALIDTQASLNNAAAADTSPARLFRKIMNK